MAEDVKAQPSERLLRPTILVLFFLSGACGLIYEVVWMRMLTLVFGATAFATSTILASFFTGLALGGFIFGRVIDKGRNPLRVYALLEGGISLFAFLMPVLLGIVTWAYVGIARQFDVGFYGISLVRFVLAFSVLVLPATLMGGTLPVIVKFFARKQEKLGWHVGQLYALNTLGAVVGTVLAGFFLILMLGVREAAYAAGVVNLLIASVVFGLDRRLGGGGAEAREGGGEGGGQNDATGKRGRPGAPGDVASGAPALSPAAARLALWAMGISGFCALAFEVFWTRALVFFLDNSTHAFTTILTAFLLGIGIGSLLIAAFIDKRKSLVGWLGLIEVLIALSAVLAIPIINHATPVFERMAGAALDTMLPWKWMGVRFINSLSVMLLPTILMGMAFPLATKIYTREVGRVGTSLGNIYAVNTLGGVFGSAMAGFVLIPAIGLQKGILLVAAINAVLGCALILSESAMKQGTRITAVAGTGVVFLVVAGPFLLGGRMTLTSYYERREIDQILSYEEGVGATVKVYRDVYGDRIISINGFPVAGEPPEYQDAQKALAHFPLLISRVPNPRVAIIGFGAGGTSWSVLQHDVEFVDCVELVPAVPRAAHFFPSVNHGVLDEPRYNLILNDGRNHVMVTDKEYDVISIDATSPKMAGNGSLYALDFYELLKERISEDGIVVQWIPHHLLSDGEVKMTARSFMTAFPHATLWFSPLRQNAVLIGTQRELEIDFGRLEAAFQDDVIRGELESVNVADAIGFLSGFLMGEKVLADYVGNIPDNTDNHPVLEFTPALAYFLAGAYRLRNVFDFRDAREIVLPWLTNLGESEEEAEAVREAVQRRYEAVGYSINGDIALVLGERERAIAEYNQALTVDPLERNWLTATSGLEELRR
ncbi:MAG: fused MFS/spermidine synthase [Gemmatimonadota bacterium]|jgi:spermidine synthase